MAKSFALPLAELATLPRRELTDDFQCVSGCSATSLQWEGVAFETFNCMIIPPIAFVCAVRGGHYEAFMTARGKKGCHLRRRAEAHALPHDDARPGIRAQETFCVACSPDCIEGLPARDPDADSPGCSAQQHRARPCPE